MNGEMISAPVAAAIGKAVEDLIEMIQFDDTPHPEISRIQIGFLPTEIVVSARFYDGDGIEWAYRYAIYINRETGKAETDGY